MHSHRPSATRRHDHWRHLLLAALLLGAQLLLAVHALDHLDAANGDRCDICLVGHNLGHGHSVSNALPPVITASQAVAPAPAAILAERPAPSPCQRGPPHSLRIV
jgi:hypothetical protein